MLEIKKCSKRPPVQYGPHPKFGTTFAPHMLKMSLTLGGQSKYQAEILPYQAEPMLPGTSVLHYGQSIFEGMKAFKQADGSIGIFRPDLHAKRFKASAHRMVMAEMPEEIFVQTLKEYVDFERESVPGEKDHALYLRPVLLATDNQIKMGASKNYSYYVMSTVVGNYFGAEGAMKPARVLVNRQFVRAYPGGMGEAKTASNYAAGVLPGKIATSKECDQVLYLDAVHHDFIDELGGMNFFAIQRNKLVTPELNGCILRGVTRQSLLEIAPRLGLEPVEKKMSFTELIKSIESGETTEMFACGTAAVVQPIGEFLFTETVEGTPRSIKPAGAPKVALQLLDMLTKIQRGAEKAPGDWIVKV